MQCASASARLEVSVVAELQGWTGSRWLACRRAHFLLGGGWRRGAGRTDVECLKTECRWFRKGVSNGQSG